MPHVEPARHWFVRPKRPNWGLVVALGLNSLLWMGIVAFVTRFMADTHL